MTASKLFYLTFFSLQLSHEYDLTELNNRVDYIVIFNLLILIRMVALLILITTVAVSH